MKSAYPIDFSLTSIKKINSLWFKGWSMVFVKEFLDKVCNEIIKVMISFGATSTKVDGKSVIGTFPVPVDCHKFIHEILSYNVQTKLIDNFVCCTPFS
jgi:hypothetical protein